MNKKLILLALTLCGWIQGISALGLYMINQTGQHLRIRMVSGLRESFKDMTPGETYFFSDAPIHMTVYAPNGGCSNFVGVQMNGSIFNYILIRKQVEAQAATR